MIPAHAQVSEALRAVEGLRVLDSPGAVVDPPAAVLGPPTWVFEAYSPEPTSTTFTVALVAAADERALERLAALVPRVAQLIHDETDASVIRAEPGSVPSGAGSAELPAYLLTIEV